MATRKKSAAKKSTSAKKKKKPFMPMEIAKVKLNQDQAVLTCCERPSGPSLSLRRLVVGSVAGHRAAMGQLTPYFRASPFFWWFGPSAAFWAKG